MSNRLLTLAAVALLAAACSNAVPNGGGGPTSDTGGGGGTGGGGTGGGGGAGGVAEAASKVADVCTVMPKDTIRALVPDAADPVTDQAYHQCTMSDGTTSIQVTLSSGFAEPDPPNPAESVSGLGEKAWLQEQSVDDAYLEIYLGSADTAGYWTMYVEYAGHDGKAHRDDAIKVATATIAALK